MKQNKKFFSFDKGKEVTLTGNLTYINKPLLYTLAFTRFDKDDFEYNYDLFELARFSKLIDELKEVYHIDKNFNNNR